MRVECYLSMGCGSEPELRESVLKAVAEAAPGAEVHFRRITDEEAARLGLRGSPSVLIDGVDIQPVEMEGFG